VVLDKGHQAVLIAGAAVRVLLALLVDCEPIVVKGSEQFVGASHLWSLDRIEALHVMRHKRDCRASKERAIGSSPASAHHELDAGIPWLRGHARMACVGMINGKVESD
jgi:hypothetical protein